MTTVDTSGSSTPPLGPTVVVGAGLVGASIGMALTAAGVSVQLVDLLPAHAQVAATLGAGKTTPHPPEQVELVVVAVPPDHIAATVMDALARWPRATVTDVGSVKERPAVEIHAAGGGERYVGSHPMAGSQQAGPLTANADLFRDRTWVIAVPDEQQQQQLSEHANRVARLARCCGATIVVMSPGDHDRAVARVSHLPHLASILVAQGLLEGPAGYLQLAGQGLRDVTRIAGSDPHLWRQIIGGNRGAIRAELEGLRSRLDRIIDDLDDDERLTEDLEEGRAGTRRIPGKHGAAPQAFVKVTVEIPDQPGALATLFQQIGETNVEDLQIEHDDARNLGYLAIFVRPEDSEAVADRMRSLGWRVS
ncbi:prephenate dehydrogenase [Parenemella sanctibonifatiensis]|uniref:Prephenate dehydrogenase n=1 Tax=Parenemella sanctibonifatiensis TaxID=2016505 RepID=A0A255E4H2_9ACTN|nr:prephenate dehydrogenase [Parenemella sanctibonifatiensis]OYN86487.1 prephenate dehydrogenase [Parenemella sanctibonifatiensis]